MKGGFGLTLTNEEKERRREYRRMKKWNETHKIMNGIDHKCCSICDNWFPSTETYFYKSKDNMVDGLHPYCKDCSKNKSNKYRIDNEEWYKNYQRKWYGENKDYKNEVDRQWFKENKDYRKEYMNDWQKENKDKLIKYRLHREANKKHEITKEEWVECKTYFNNSCCYCGFTEEEHRKTHNQDLHKDHLDHAGANDLSNCVPACKSCNSKKRDYPVEQFYERHNIDKERIVKINKWLSEDYKQFIKIQQT